VAAEERCDAFIWRRAGRVHDMTPEGRGKEVFVVTNFKQETSKLRSRTT